MVCTGSQSIFKALESSHWNINTMLNGKNSFSFQRWYQQDGEGGELKRSEGKDEEALAVTVHLVAHL